MTRIRQRASSQQLKDEKSKPEGLAVLDKDFDRAESIEFEVQRRLKSATEDLENEVNNLQVQLSASNQSFRDEKKQLERRFEQLQSDLSVAESRRNELNNALESIAKVTTGQRYDYHQNIKALNQEIAHEREWIRRQDEDLLSKDRETKKMNKEKERKKEIRRRWEEVDFLALEDNLVRDGDICGLSVT